MTTGDVTMTAPGMSRALLVMLPGAGMQAQDFEDRGVVRAMHNRGLPVDAVAVAAGPDLYVDGTIVARLHADVVGPAVAEGYARIWFLGISLGGMGALLYARTHPSCVEGILLLAPFLGAPGTIAEVTKAGGLSGWSPARIAANDLERSVLSWLKSYRSGSVDAPRLYLGYGREDRFAEAHVVLASRLPAGQVVLAEGGHDWETWMVLWCEMLARQPFPAALAAETHTAAGRYLGVRTLG